MDPHFSYKICDGENFWVGHGAQGVEPEKGEKVVLLQLLIIGEDALLIVFLWWQR